MRNSAFDSYHLYKPFDSFNLYNPQSVPDPDDPTVPDLPAYVLNLPSHRTTQRQGPVAAMVSPFNRLSLGARSVLVGCVLLLAFCLLSPYVNTSLGETIAQLATGAPTVTKTMTKTATARAKPPTASSGSTAARTSAGAVASSRRAPILTSPPAPGSAPLRLTITCATVGTSSGSGSLCVSTLPGAQVTAILASCPSGPKTHATTTSMRIAGTADANGVYAWTGQLDDANAKCHGAPTAVVTVSHGNESASERITFARAKA